MTDKTVDNSPRGKISRGVTDTVEARRGRRTPPLAHLLGRKATPESLKTLLNDCRSRLSKLKAVRDAAATALAEESERIRTHYENEGYLPGEREGQKEDILGASRRKAMIDRAIVQSKKTIYSAIEADVTALMVQVRADEEKVKSAREAWVSPIQVLLDMTLDSEKRAVYAGNLASAGQTGLTNAARTALRNTDLALAAAVIAAIDNLPKRSREALTISKDDIAETIMADRFYESTDMLAVSEFVIAEAHLTGREGLGRQRSSTDTVALGLKRDAVEEELGRPLTDKDSVWLPVVGNVEQQHSDVKMPAAEASAKALAEAKALSDKNQQFADAKFGSPEWISLGRELGYGADENTGDENDGTE